MAWLEPKTDWYGSTVDGVYSGDYFNAKDYNRIKNNLQHVKALASELYGDIAIRDMGNDKGYSDFLYASELNAIEYNLSLLNARTLNLDYGVQQQFSDNGKMIDFEELNRIESATLDLYSQLSNQINGRRMFTWNFGMTGGM